MAVFHNKKLIFVHVPKTGGTYFTTRVNNFSIKNKFNYVNIFGRPSLGNLSSKLLYESLEDVELHYKPHRNKINKTSKEILQKLFGTSDIPMQHLSYLDILLFVQELYDTDISHYNSFAVIREPEERIISALYRDKISINNINSFLLDIKRKSDYKKPIMYSKFSHYKRQKDLIEGTKNLIKFENIENDLIYYIDLLNNNKKTNLSSVNKNKSKNIDKYNEYKSEIRKKYKKIIFDIYEEDFYLYNNLS